MRDKEEKEMLEERREGERRRQVPESHFRVGLFPRRKENTEGQNHDLTKVSQQMNRRIKEPMKEFYITDVFSTSQVMSSRVCASDKVISL